MTEYCSIRHLFAIRSLVISSLITHTDMKKISKIKRALFTMALMIPAGNFAWGQWQVVASESFEQSCSNSSNAFYTNCIPNWTSASGTPDNSSLLGAAYDGSKYAHLYANYNGSCAQGEGSEGIL